jgi:hypothetical protein
MHRSDAFDLIASAIEKQTHLLNQLLTMPPARFLAMPEP